MKRVITAIAAILFTMAGCTGNRQAADGIVTVDVTASYPKKELILQDFMDVEYIPLETNDEFICQGLVMDIGENVLIVRNHNADGDIFLFDRKTGKALKKINRKGQGGEEYTYTLTVTLDEGREELLVNDYLARKILVYDMEGNFKRSFKHLEGLMYTAVYKFGEEHLICFDGYSKSFTPGRSFVIISGQDGRVANEISIPFEEKKTIVITQRNEATGMAYSYSPSGVHPLAPNLGHWMLMELSSDTIYSCSPGRRITPLIARTPPVRSMNPEVFLLQSLYTDRYYFLETIKKEMEYPGTDLVYDRQEKALFRYTVLNGDYTNKERAFLKSKPVNSKIPSVQSLEAGRLVEALGKGELKGRLKEIASALDEDSNPVLMLIKHKK